MTKTIALRGVQFLQTYFVMMMNMLPNFHALIRQPFETWMIVMKSSVHFHYLI